MTKQMILIQHTNGTTPGHVLPWLQSKKIPFRHVRLQKGDAVPDLEDTAGLILCGGGVHVDQEDKYPWLRPEKKYIEACLQKGLRVMGLCLGGQLLAQILGAKVYPHPQGWEIGWTDVDFKGSEHWKAFREGQKMKVSQYHRYIFDLPAGAKALATNSWWAPQAFEWKNQVIGFQFHPERDLAGNRHLVEDIEPDPTEGIVHSREEMRILGDQFEPVSRQWFLGLLDEFLPDEFKVSELRNPSSRS